MTLNIEQLYFDSEDHNLVDTLARSDIDKFSTQVNLIENSDWELGTDYWRIWGNNPNYPEAEIREITEDENGIKWFHLKTPANTRYQGFQQQASRYGLTRKLKKNTNYLITVRAYGKKEGTSLAVAIHFNKNNTKLDQWTETKIINTQETVYCWTVRTPDIECNNFNFMIGQWSMTKKEDELWVTDISMKEFPLELSNIIKEYPQLKEDISSTSIVTSDTGYLSFGNGLEETSLKSLKIKIPLTQFEQEPSPDTEPLEFNGWSKDFIFSHRGKNLIDNTSESLTEGDSVSWAKKSNGVISATGIANNNSIFYLSKDGFLLPPGKYILTDTGEHLQGCLWYSLNDESEVQVSDGESTFELNEAQIIKIWCAIPSGVDASNETFIPMLRFYYIDDTYEPYKQAKNYHINFPSDQIDEIYEGYVDVIKGKLVVTKYLHTINPDRFGGANEDAIADVVRGYIYNLPTSIPKSTGKNAEALCNYFPRVAVNYNANVQGFYFYNERGVYFKISKNLLANIYPSLSLSEAFIQYFRDHEVKIIYPLETPKEYPITALDIKTYSGVNTFLSEENSFEVEYRTNKNTDWIYVNPNSLVRSNGEFLLDAGDGINFTNNDLQYFIRYINNSKEVKIFDWKSADTPFICPEDGLYTIIVKRKSQSIDLNLLEKVENAVTIYRNKSIYTNLFNNHKTYTIGHSSGGNASDSNMNTPENSIAGLKNYAQRGYWAVSCDIRLTKDFVWVLMHDQTIDRTTTGTGNVSEKTLEQLKQYRLRKAKKRNDTQTDSPVDEYISEETVPTLEEWLLEARKLGVIVSVQIENCGDVMTKDKISDIITIIKKLKMKKQVMLCAFEMQTLLWIKEIDREISTSILTRNWPLFVDGQPNSSIAKLAVFGNTWIGQNQDKPNNITREQVEKYQSIGIPVGMWTSYPGTRQNTVNLLPLGFDFWSAESLVDVNSLIVTDEENENLISQDNMCIGPYDEYGNRISVNPFVFEQSTDFILIKPSTPYTFFCWVTIEENESNLNGYWQRINWYNINKELIHTTYLSDSSARGYYEKRSTYISPSNACYVTFSFRSYQDGVCAMYEGNKWKTSKPDWNIKNNTHLTDIYNPKSIAHRGYTVSAPENTEQAFLMAKQRGFKFVECDVRFTLDGMPVLSHNSFINNNATNLDGSAIEDTVYIHETSYNDLYNNYNYNIWKNEEDKKNSSIATILTLSSFLILCRDLDLYPYIEIKPDHVTVDQIRNVADAIHSYGLDDKASILSFDYKVLNYVKTTNSKVRLGYLTDSNVNWENALRYCQILKTEKNSVFVSAKKETLIPDPETGGAEWRLLWQNNIPLEVWLIDEDTSYNDLSMEKQVTGFITNEKKFEEITTKRYEESNNINLKNALTRVTGSSATYTLTENEFVDFGIKQNLTVMMPLQGEYRFAFISANPATSLTLSGVQMPEDFEINSYRRYEINIFNGYGVAQDWGFVEDLYPARVITDTFNGITVEVNAPQGALPKNTTLELQYSNSDYLSLGCNISIYFLDENNITINPLKEVEISIRDSRAGISGTEFMCQRAMSTADTIQPQILSTTPPTAATLKCNSCVTCFYV